MENINKEENIILESSSKDIINEYLNDQKTIEKLDELAIHFNEISRNKWIGLNFLERKSIIKNKQELSMLLDLLILSKRAFAKKVGGVTMYRFTLNKDQRKKVLQNTIKEMEGVLATYKKELEELK